ncbi:hypothetical protein B0H13DRAFT_2651677 [Mycena leptocephala]|nr:hypothetical protein B0H13DRAFT_2651677 [Mycena leptocephala]
MVGAAVAVEMVTNPSFNDHTKLLVSEISWIAASAAADAAIAIGLHLTPRTTRVSWAIVLFVISLPPFCSVMLRAGVIRTAFSIAARCPCLTTDSHPLYSASCQTNLSFAIIISLGRIYTHAMLRNLNLRDPKPAEVRQSLPHAIQLTSYPFMPDTPGTTASQEMQKKGGRPFIPAVCPPCDGLTSYADPWLAPFSPLVFENPRPDHLLGRSMLLQPLPLGQLGSVEVRGVA